MNETWILCENLLPEENKDVLLYCVCKQSYGDIITNCDVGFRQDNEWYVNDECYEEKNVIGWMPLPETGIGEINANSFGQETKVHCMDSIELTGEWKAHYSTEDGNRDGIQCNQCNEWWYFGGAKPNFCPNCGARMQN